ncbi:single-stranded DNA-binding protein [Acholeplasma sp. OttesenSCG-928-E16]|nr:single-stranded DNA-binding protein [Acholeplasma sp. OttesenSCG-928-E16]
MLNQVILIGRIAHDPELKTLEDGRKVSEISLAVQRAFKNLDGEYDCDFIKIVLWEGLATSTENYCKKGTMIAVKGRLQTWKKELDDDAKLNMLEVIGERITYLQNSKVKEPHQE